MSAPCDIFLPKDGPTDDSSRQTIRLGVARCLLGENVRYNGGHKLDPYIASTLGRFVEFVPVCPEVECGMSVPREALRLVGDPAAPRLLTQKTKKDYTEQMQEWGRKRLELLDSQGICGYIFKSKSPSSGMGRVKVYSEDGKSIKPSGSGIWANMVMQRYPGMPFEDDGRLHDAALRENFIERVFVYKRLREMLQTCEATGKAVGELVRFHTRHKLLVMAHSPKHYTQMGRLVAQAKGMDQNELFCEYVSLLMRALELRATVKKNVNVLQHLAGYFKKQLSADEKQELHEHISHYADGLVPIVVPLTLINHYVRKYDETYLAEQYYLAPHPVELMLRNHV